MDERCQLRTACLDWKKKETLGRRHTESISGEVVFIKRVAKTTHAIISRYVGYVSYTRIAE